MDNRSSSAIPRAHTSAEIRSAVTQARAAGKSIGLVPTMGALHQAHARLIQTCSQAAGFTVVSIFVNPTQFGPSEDFAKYPRTMDADLDLCAKAGASLVFAPDVPTMYPHGMASTFVEVPGVSHILEGASRPGHFRGVATVVLKLFEMVRPDLAYFGQKDYQQLLVIKRMVEDLAIPVEIRSLPTVREPDGLAMSSRNRYLNGAQRQAAAILSAALKKAEAAVAAGEREADRVRQILQETIQSEPMAQLDYAVVADGASLQPLETLRPGQPAVALVAAKVGSARLIDNLRLPV